MNLLEVVKNDPTVKQKKKLNVAAYARVSSKKDEQYGSLVMQKEYYREYIKNNPDWNYVGIYADDSSGLNATKRQELLAMLDDCRKGRIDMILCKSPSRLSRNVVDGLTILRELRELGIEIVFECCQMSIFDPKAEMYYSIMFSLYQEESHSRSESTKWGLKRAMENGSVKIYNRPCYGYRKDEATGKLIIYEPEAKVVRKIFEWNREKKGSSTIVKLLKNEGIKSPTGKEEWKPAVILNILNNEKYYGNVVLGKSYTKDFISKKTVKNCGERPLYKVIDNHKGIIPKA